VGPLGGYIGFRRTPSRIAASGVWRLRDAESFVRDNQWPGGNDLLFANVAVLLNFEGASIVDASAAARSVNVLGNSSQSTTQVKHGSKSLFCDGDSEGTGVTISHATPDGFAANAGDWTIEMWAYPTSLHNGHLCIISDAGLSTVGLQWHLTSSGQMVLNSAAAGAFQGGSYAANQWQHFAAVRSSGVITIYKDGVSQGTTTQTPGGNGTTIAFGQSSGNFGSNYFQGYLDDIRYTRGAARYTSSPFAPPRDLQTQ